MRLHDLRHGAASLAHQAGADLKILQDLLRNKARKNRPTRRQKPGAPTLTAPVVAAKPQVNRPGGEGKSAGGGGIHVAPT